MISIAIINLKGGVGKSVTACNLAAELAAKSKSVLVVDLDKQGNTSKFFGVADYDRPCVSSVLLGMAMVRDAIGRRRSRRLPFSPATCECSRQTAR